MQPPPLPPPLPSASSPYANPYAAPVARLEEFDAGDLVLASRGTRLGAAIVDNIILIVPAVVLVAAVVGLGGKQMTSDSDWVLIWLAAMLPILAVVVVNLVLLNRNGQTIAKRMFGIKVLRTDGSPCSVLRIIFMRWLPVTLLGALPIIGYASGLIDALMIFGQQQRCLHDLIADTMVVQA